MRFIGIRLGKLGNGKFYNMHLIKLFIYLVVITCIGGVKVNMQGSLSLGKEVVDGLSYYLRTNVLSGRRSLMPIQIEDSITLIVRSAILCRNLNFCGDKLGHFVDEYVIMLAKAVESVIDGSRPDFNGNYYEDQLKYTLEYVRKILEDANDKMEEGNEAYYWVHVLKKISGKFEELSEIFGGDVEVDDPDTVNTKKELDKKIVIAIVFVERKYKNKLCSEHEVCSESHECTRALNKILMHFKTLPEDKIRSFIKQIYEALFETSFYSYLSQATGHNFQVILNDMAYSEDVPAKDLMLSVQKTVEARMMSLQANKGIHVGHDILMAHAILSDIDHMYSTRKPDPFVMFLNRYYDWLASDVLINKHIRAVIADIANEIWTHEEVLVNKLIHEVRVFLDMTVSPEK